MGSRDMLRKRNCGHTDEHTVCRYNPRPQLRWAGDKNESPHFLTLLFKIYRVLFGQRLVFGENHVSPACCLMSQLGRFCRH